MTFTLTFGLVIVTAMLVWVKMISFGLLTALLTYLIMKR